MDGDAFFEQKEAILNKEGCRRSQQIYVIVMYRKMKRRTLLIILLSLLAVFLIVGLVFSSQREGVDDDSIGEVKKIGYLICDNQSCFKLDKNNNPTKELNLDNFRQVISGFTINQWKSLIYSQNGPYINGSNTAGSGERKNGQSYKILGITDLNNTKNNTIDFSVTLLNGDPPRVKLTPELVNNIEYYYHCLPYQIGHPKYVETQKCQETKSHPKSQDDLQTTGNQSDLQTTGNVESTIPFNECHSIGYWKKKYNVVPDNDYESCYFIDSKNKSRQGKQKVQ